MLPGAIQEALREQFRQCQAGSEEYINLPAVPYQYKWEHSDPWTQETDGIIQGKVAQGQGPERGHDATNQHQDQELHLAELHDLVLALDNGRDEEDEQNHGRKHCKSHHT